MIDPDIIEHMCRTICRAQGIDPDGTGWAMLRETEKRLGKEYKLWKYQIPLAEEICSEFGIGY